MPVMDERMQSMRMGCSLRGKGCGFHEICEQQGVSADMEGGGRNTRTGRTTRRTSTCRTACCTTATTCRAPRRRPSACMRRARCSASWTCRSRPSPGNRTPSDGLTVLSSLLPERYHQIFYCSAQCKQSLLLVVVIKLGRLSTVSWMPC